MVSQQHQSPSSSSSQSSSSSSFSKHTRRKQPQPHPQSQQRRRYKNSTRERSIQKGKDPLLSLNMNLDYLGKSGQVDAAKRAEELLHRIQALYRDGYYAVQPDTVSYNSVIHAHAIGGNVSKAQELLESMLPRTTTTATTTTTTTTSNTTNMSSTTTNNNNNENKSDLDTDMSTNELRNINNNNNNDNNDVDDAVEANIVTFNTVIRAFAKSNEPLRAEQVLKQAEELYNQTQNPVLRPTTISYNSIMDAWARRGQPLKAEAWLRRMMEIGHAQKHDSNCATLEEWEMVKPDATSFNTVLNAWAASRTPEAAKRAQLLLAHMNKLYRAGNESVKPDVFSYTSVIKALAYSYMHNSNNNNNDSSGSGRSSSISSSSNQYPRRGQEGSGVMDKGLHQALKLLAHMEKVGQTKDPDILPNIITYSCVMNALSKRGFPEEAERLLEQMIVRAKASSSSSAAAAGNQNDSDDSESQNARNIQPDTIAYTSVIDAYARQGNAAKALELLSQMKQMAAASFSSSMADNAAWNNNNSNNNNYDDNDNVEWLVKPNTRTYCAVISCLAKTSTAEMPDAASVAIDLLRDMEELYRVTGDADVKPNRACFNAVMDAIARSSLPSKAQLAYSYLQRMQQESGTVVVNDDDKDGNKNNGVVHGNHGEEEETSWAQQQQQQEQTYWDRDLSPDVISYNSVLLACANSYGNAETRQNAVSLAVRVFKELFGPRRHDTTEEEEEEEHEGEEGGDNKKKKNNPTPNYSSSSSQPLQATSISYTLFLKTIRKHAPTEEIRQSLAQKAFQLCCRNGMVNSKVLSQMQMITSMNDDKDKNKTNNNDSIYYRRIQDLPREWTRHAMTMSSNNRYSNNNNNNNYYYYNR